MDKSKLFALLCADKRFLSLKAMHRLFGTIIDRAKNDTASLNDTGKVCTVHIGDESIPIPWYKPETPIFTIEDEIEVTPETFRCLDEKKKTSIGVALLNFAYVEYGLDAKIPWMDNVSMNAITGAIVLLVADNVKDEKGNYISIAISNDEDRQVYVRDYERMSDVDGMVQEWNQLFVHSMTLKTIKPAPGIKKFKADLELKYDKKYGKDWGDNPVLAVQYDDEVIDYDLKYLEDDPSLGVVAGNKIVKLARKKLYGTYGVEKNPFDTKAEPMHMKRSLSEQWDMSEDGLPVYNNTIRAGSYDKGKSTQGSGTIAKVTTRALQSQKYAAGDCGTKFGEIMYDVDAKRFANRFILVNGKTIPFDASKHSKGKIVMRTPMFCHDSATTTCQRCSTDSMLKTPNGPLLQGTDVGGIIVNGDMKAMHGKIQQTTKVDLLMDF